MEWTVWSMLTTTPFFRPAAGTEPLPMIVMLPSRLTSPMSATTFVVPTSIPTRTASRSTVLMSLAAERLEEVSPDECDVLEDPWPERDQCHEVEVQAEPIADEGEQNGHACVGDEPADEDPIVVDAIQLCPDRPQNGIECSHDCDGGIPGEFEADVDVE